MAKLRGAMLDYHYITFLTVCETLNYTRAAELMNLTQPTVSHHIAFLEEELGVKLFSHKNKKVYLTPEGEYLQQKVIFMQNQGNKTIAGLSQINYPTINLGATLSLSDYVMPRFLGKMFRSGSKFSLNLEVENTETLLHHLAQGKIDAAFIEGNFNKDIFSSLPFESAEIIGICSPVSALAQGEVSWPALFQEPLLIREKGSGTRDAFETILTEEQISLASFKEQTSLGSLTLIKQLVSDNLGISFLFDICVKEELAQGKLKKLSFKDDFGRKDLHFVYLADNPTTVFMLKMIQQLTE